MQARAMSLGTLFLALAAAVSVRADTPVKGPSGKGPPPEAASRKTPTAVDFVHDVMPLLNRAGCNQTACHGASNGRSGFKLTLFGADPSADYAALTRADSGRRINRLEPEQSLFLLKTTTQIPHKGGQKFAPDSPEFKMLLQWVTQGAVWKDAGRPDVVSVKVSPDQAKLDLSTNQQLRLTAVLSDGSEQDVTRLAQFSSTDDGVAAIDESGLIQAKSLGQAFVIAAYMRHTAISRVIMPQKLPSPFPATPANNTIDEFVAAKLRELGIPPSEPCSDAHFLRRVYLDVIGTLPTADEAVAFLSDKDPQKRDHLIDRLLASDEFAEYWALKWGDLLRVKSEYPNNLWPNAVQAYHRWLRDSIRDNKPYDQFVRELVTASGSNFRVPPANFYRAFLQRTPQNLAEVTALLFMGARIGCARCHAHPVERWTLDDNLGLAAFFAQVQYKRTQEWKEEIVYVNPKRTFRDPRTNELVQPKFPGADAIPADTTRDMRVPFADALINADNPWFTRNIVNRVWFWLLGRGIVHEPDDLRSTNPPENAALLDCLAQELVDHKYDLKHIYRLILTSATYQRSSKSNQWNQDDIAHFSHYQVKRLGAEVLLDAIGQVTERWDTYRSTIPEPFVVMPNGFRATHLADGSVDLPFLQMFGRPTRNSAYESERDLEPSMRQTLHLLNSSDVQNKINASPWLRRLMQEKKTDAEIVDAVFLRALSRFPSDEEKQKVTQYLVEHKNRHTQAIQDLLWAVLNTKEFLFIH